ncbi:hypothetical protein PYCCODRAFT_1036257 [Trametes coccinea BRFM310]|uniref:Uncharacterized protein n=1 Tax=Trametes coccinea (strain BRFM310) TaxID=1353009 RepID=A0A1Y2IAG7_TRAC3|nr:hypothetical protein PYCCODRAFT_1036257 [Trametes coccinea BRFM310]
MPDKIRQYDLRGTWWMWEVDLNYPGAWFPAKCQRGSRWEVIIDLKTVDSRLVPVQTDTHVDWLPRRVQREDDSVVLFPDCPLDEEEVWGTPLSASLTMVMIAACTSLWCRPVSVSSSKDSFVSSSGRVAVGALISAGVRKNPRCSFGVMRPLAALCAALMMVDIGCHGCWYGSELFRALRSLLAALRMRSRFGDS